MQQGTIKWLRLYHEARTDAKLESLPDDQFRVWFRLLCFAGEQPTRGSILQFSPRLLAVEVAHGDMALLEATLTALRELRIIETGEGACVAFTNWTKRQYESDNINGRVARWREKQRQEQPQQTTPARNPRAKKASGNVTSARGNGHVTLQKRYSNNDVTPPDTDTDTERDTSEGNVSVDGEVTPLFFAVADADGPVSGIDESAEHTLQAIASNGHIPPGQRRADADPPKKPAAPPRATGGPNVLWDALVAAFGYAPESKDERNRWGMVVRDLKGLKATPAQVAQRCQNHHDAAVHWTLTPRALVTHWGELGALVPLARASPHVEQATRLPGRSAPAFRPASELSPWATVDAQRAAVAAKEAG